MKYKPWWYVRAWARVYGKKIVQDAFRWRPGRQGTAYEKMLLLVSPLPLTFDMYLLRWADGAEVPQHKDPAPIGGRHFRLNVLLKAPRAGGQFLCEDTIFATRRITFFRPDLVEHSLTRSYGPGYMLSIGWLRKV